MTAAEAGQVYDWLGAEVLVDEVAEDDSGARITVRQDGCRPRQKWQPLPFPPEAVLVRGPGADEGEDRCRPGECDCQPVAIGTDAVQAAAAEITSLP